MLTLFHDHFVFDGGLIFDGFKVSCQNLGADRFDAEVGQQRAAQFALKLPCFVHTVPCSVGREELLLRRFLILLQPRYFLRMLKIVEYMYFIYCEFWTTYILFLIDVHIFGLLIQFSENSRKTV